MPPKLRPRAQLPPQDHNYAKSLTHLPMYSENGWPVILKGPNGIFEKERSTTPVEERKEENSAFVMDSSGDRVTVVIKVERKRAWSASEDGVCGDKPAEESTGEEPAPKRKRRKFFKGTTYEPKRRRKRKASSVPAPAAEAVSSAKELENDICSNTEMVNSVQVEVHSETDTGANVLVREEAVVDDGAILLNPVADDEGATGLYNLSFTTSHTESEQTPAPKMKRICSSCTKECHWRKKRCASLPPESDSRRQSERLIKLNYKFPFEDLPDVCKLKIFSYLQPCDKGRAAQVCQEWRQLMRSPGLWAHMNFSAFNPAAVSQKCKSFRGVKAMPLTFHGQFPWFCNNVEYDEYKGRVHKFLTYVQDIKPKLKSLSFVYDLGEPKDEWLKWITDLLDKAQCQDLTHANIDWTSTPLRLSCTDRYCCLFNKMQIKYRLHEKRVKYFNKLQGVLAKVAPKLSHLKVPFDWSPRSVLLMCRLKQLRTLQLGQYMMLLGVRQEMVDTLLRNMPQLRELEIRVCSPHQNYTTTYSIAHSGLQLLDVSTSKGFFIHELECPQLTVLKIGRFPWKGPIVDKETNKLPCVYSLCQKGTPRLSYINRHHLQPYWTEFLYDELNAALCKLCSCKDHLYPEHVPPAAAAGPSEGEAAVDHPGHQAAPEFGAAVNFVPDVQQALVPLVPLIPLIPTEGVAVATGDRAHSPQLGANKCVVDDAIPSTSKALPAVPSTSKGTGIPVSSKGKSCSRFKAKRSKPPPEKDPSENSDSEEQIIPIEHSTVEVRSTPRINTVPLVGTATHVAVIPIRVVDPRAVPSSSEPLSTVPVAVQSISLQPQVIAVDKLTGTHVLSGPLTVVKHIIQVVPKAPEVNALPHVSVTPALPAIAVSPAEVTFPVVQPASVQTLGLNFAPQIVPVIGSQEFGSLQGTVQTLAGSVETNPTGFVGGETCASVKLEHSTPGGSFPDADGAQLVTVSVDDDVDVNVQPMDATEARIASGDEARKADQDVNEMKETEPEKTKKRTRRRDWTRCPVGFVRVVTSLKRGVKVALRRRRKLVKSGKRPSAVIRRKDWKGSRVDFVRQVAFRKNRLVRLVRRVRRLRGDRHSAARRRETT